MNWLTFESLFLSEDSLSLELDFCSAAVHCGLLSLCIYLFTFLSVLQAGQVMNPCHFFLANWNGDWSLFRQA